MVQELSFSLVWAEPGGLADSQSPSRITGSPSVMYAVIAPIGMLDLSRTILIPDNEPGEPGRVPDRAGEIPAVSETA